MDAIAVDASAAGAIPNDPGSKSAAAAPAPGPAATERLTPLREMQLIKAHAEGDPDAMGTLLRSYQGRIYAVWQDSRFTGFDQVAFIQSRNGGRTWSDPVRINLTPPNVENPLRQQAFLPSVAVNRRGRVAVSYYDFRNDDDSGELADHFMVFCDRRCSRRSSWRDEVRLTEESFDYLNAPQAGGLFLGDYVGLAAARNDFYAFFQQASPEDPASGFSVRVREDDDDDD